MQSKPSRWRSDPYEVASGRRLAEGLGVSPVEPIQPAWGNQKTITFTGKTVDPVSGKEMNVRETYKIIDDNNHVMEMYMTNEGKELKTMEIKFKRK